MTTQQNPVPASTPNTTVVGVKQGRGIVKQVTHLRLLCAV